MAHEDPRLVPYLAGDLAAAQLDAFESHLVGCDACWEAVAEDRQGRLLAESLREVAPAALRDRVTAAAALAGAAPFPAPPAGRGAPGRRRLAAALALAGAVSMAAGLVTLAADRDRDPAVVAAVVGVADDMTVPPMIVAGGLTVSLDRDLVDGAVVTVGRSDVPFPMPAGGRPLGTGPGAPWVAERGPMTVVCVSRPAHLLLVGHLPAERLVALAAAITGPRATR